MSFIKLILEYIKSIFRNILGTGSLLAFPGSMIGAFLSGVFFKKTKSKSLAILGEIIGTGILGALISYPIAKIFMGKDIAALFFIVPFLVSTIGGSIIAYIVLVAFEKNSSLKKLDF